MPIFFPQRDYTPAQRFMRILLMITVVSIVVWAYWKNTERRVEMLREIGSISDKTGALSADDRSFIKGFSNKLKADFGMEFRLRADNGPPERPDLDGKTMYIGIDVKNRVVELILPPLMAKALSQDFAAYVQEQHFNPYWDGGLWPEGLNSALLLIWNRLTTLDENSGPALQHPESPASLPTLEQPAPARPEAFEGPSVRMPVTQSPPPSN